MKLFAILISILMVGCSPSIQMPGFTKQAPDVLTNDNHDGYVDEPKPQQLNESER